MVCRLKRIAMVNEPIRPTNMETTMIISPDVPHSHVIIGKSSAVIIGDICDCDHFWHEGSNVWSFQPKSIEN